HHVGKDFGNFQIMDLSGKKFEDLNANGKQDAGEPGLSGWTILLNGTDGMGDTVSLTTTTVGDTQFTAADETGTYTFAGLRPGIYSVSEQLQPGWIQSAPGVNHNVLGAPGTYIGVLGGSQGEE